MRLYGLLEKLTKVILVNGKNIEVTPTTQSGASDKIITIPDMASNASQEMVLDKQAQTLLNKTFTSPVIDGVITSPSGNKIGLGAGANLLQFAGANGNSVSLSAVNLSASRTFTFPDNSGEFVTTSSVGVVTSNMIADGTIVNADINASAAIVDTKLATISSANKVSASALDIDGASDIAADLADADLILVDDGGAGTNRKAAVSRIPTYVFPKISGDITVTSAGVAAIGAGVIVNADINASAAIADTKLATISTAGKVSGTAITSGDINTTGSFTTSGDIAVNGGDLTTTSTTFNLINTTATTVNFAGAATAIAVGAATGTTTVNNNLVVTGNLTINGTTTTVNTANLFVEDKLITLNDGGIAASGGGVGIEVEENAVITGYVKVTADRNGWELKAPNSANVVTIPNSLAAGDVVLTAGTQTITGSKTFSNQINVTGPNADTFVLINGADGAIELSRTNGAFIDFKNANADDFDTRISVNTAGTLDISAAGVGTPLLSLPHNGASAFGGTAAVKIPVGTSAQQPGQAGQPAAAQGMIRYNSTQNAFEGYDGSTWSGLGGGGTTDRISGSFAIGDVIYLNGSTPTKAQADTAAKAEVVGVVSKEITAGSLYEITLVGEVSGLLAANFTENALPAAGEAIFLSATVAGKMTITEPSVVGQISIPLGVASGSGTMYVAPKRGAVVGGANVRTSITLASPATTNVQNVSAYEAGELTGWVTISATTPLRFFVRAAFARNGAASDYNLSYQTTGDTPPAGFSMGITTAGVITATLPSIGGYSTASINFALNAPAVGATLPLQISGGNVTGPVLGSTSGVAPAAGYVGEVISAEQNTFITTGMTNSTTVAFLNITLTPGTWLISASQTVLQNGSTGTAFSSTISDVSTSGNTVTGIGLSVTDVNTWPTNNVTSSTTTHPSFVYSTSVSKTIYLNSYALFSVGTPSRKGTIRAVRIA